MKTKIKNKIKKVFHDKTVVLVAIVCLTLMTMTAIVLGVNFSANFFGLQVNVKTPQTERIQDRVKDMVAAGNEEGVFNLLKENVIPDSETNVNLNNFEDFKATVGDLSPEDINVIQSPGPSGGEQIVVQIKGMDVATGTDWRWNNAQNRNENLNS